MSNGFLSWQEIKEDWGSFPWNSDFLQIETIVHLCSWAFSLLLLASAAQKSMYTRHKQVMYITTHCASFAHLFNQVRNSIAYWLFSHGMFSVLNVEAHVLSYAFIQWWFSTKNSPLTNLVDPNEGSGIFPWFILVDCAELALWSHAISNLLLNRIR